MRLIASVFSKPSRPGRTARNTSAIPPTAMRSSSLYFPNQTGVRRETKVARTLTRGGPSLKTDNLRLPRAVRRTQLTPLDHPRDFHLSDAHAAVPARILRRFFAVPHVR